MTRIAQCLIPSLAIQPMAEEWMKQARHNEFGLKMDLSHALAELDSWADKFESAVFVGFDDGPDGQVAVGFFAIFAVETPIGRIGLEKYWWAREGSRAGMVLFEAARKWAKDHDCTHFMVAGSNLASDMHDKVCQLCLKKGMKLFETTFIEDLCDVGSDGQMVRVRSSEDEELSAAAPASAKDGDGIGSGSSEEGPA